MNKKVQQIATSFRDALGFPQVTSKSGAELLFDNDLFSALFRERFGIASENKESFNAAFRDVTEGVGGEITKINSVTSSALLPLLFFYKLYHPQEGKSIFLTLDNKKYEFTRAFYEVRNNVVRIPSCVDIALVSHDENIILFLESKLTEFYEDTKEQKEYGSSYKPLYEKNGIKSTLKNSGITIDEDAQNLILLSNNKPVYIEGIKQTISHLIGLVKGPQEAKDQEDYISAYNRAKHLIYSPILYDTTNILGGDSNEYTSFFSLYSNVIGLHGDNIIKDIQEWTKINCGKSIEVRQSVLTYQELVKENPNWLDDKVKLFYRL